MQNVPFCNRPEVGTRQGRGKGGAVGGMVVLKISGFIRFTHTGKGGRQTMASQSAEERKRQYLEHYHNELTAEEKASHLLMAPALLARLERRKAAEAAQEAEDAEQAQIDQTARYLLKDVDV